MYILETQSETFVEPQDFESNKIINPYSFGKIPKDAVIDLKQKPDDSGIEGAQQLYIVAVDETGTEGSIYEITMSDPKHMLEADRKAGLPKHVIERRLSHKKSFAISDVNVKFYLQKCEAKSVSDHHNQYLSNQSLFQQNEKMSQNVMKVELFPELGFFIVCQSSGAIRFFDI